LSGRNRIVILAGGVAVSVALIAWYVVSWVVSFPPTVRATTSGSSAKVTFQTVAAYGHAPHPDWVSYLTLNAKNHWVHSTIVQVPAHSLVTFTVENYDGASGLRNPLWSQPRGVVGGTETVDGKSLRVLSPDEASHTFAIPDLGVSVEIPGVADDAPNQCEVTPCDHSMAHRTITFTIRTGKPGHYRWQCFVPCAAGFPNGFGGPMQTLGWMDGYLNVTA
jgi:hypothetical protein